ncbi:DUF2326 domain-containing protein [Tuberibacillus sp. Marseille-P3662]|uniref:DUF2326 domain-containing protein n=1 Tax=Tuberibacillus sp. Marseille-P3662 TaxID=1965358 RepID=UPI000A1CC13F|nr:DUF2326 domain-containing protein [Tuberibacillus sp. Marseille-P3662]
MLIEIRCEIFREKVITFNKGLNVILGDNSGSNSIGKSTLLMILDFIFGGDTYITHNKDVISKLGHHEFLYTFKFNNNEFYFIRGTKDPKIIYKCDEKFNIQDSMELNSYKKFLKDNYKLQSKDLKFREAVSLFSRVWGKKNYDVKRPLHNHHAEKNVVTITRLIKLFNQYYRIVQEDEELKQLTESKKVLNNAGKFDYVPKINKKKYDQNLKEIHNLKNEIEKLSKSFFSPSIQISDIISEELLELRKQKNVLTEERDYFKSRYNRTDKNIIRSTEVGFETLLEFFPDVNLEKLKSIEEFHDGISTILDNELKQVRKELKRNIEVLNKEIDDINQKMERLLSPNEQHTIYTDNLIEYTSKLEELQRENRYYEDFKTLNDNVASKTKSLSKMKEEIVDNINVKINAKLSEINDLIHDDKRSAPKIKLTNKNYNYEYSENTGTGKAYTNLIIFDLAMFNLTKIPFLIHDSFLFKNIEKSAVENLIYYYNKFHKQAFISIDVINIYEKEVQKILNNKSVINLSTDKLLFTKDWRDESKDE